MMNKKAFQDYYPANLSHCYGCGSLNEHGLQIKSYWADSSTAESGESVCLFQPKVYHTAIPGYVYGGLLASLIDCHGTGTAAAAVYRLQGREMDTLPALRYVTASLHVDYLKPTPLGPVLELRGKVKEIGGKPVGRKVVVAITLAAEGVVCVRGEIVTVQVPEDWLYLARPTSK